MDLDVFRFLVAQSSDVSSTFIAMSTASNPALVYRILRALSGIGLVSEKSSDKWTANAATKAAASSTMASWYRVAWDFGLTAGVKGPEFLRENGYKAAEDPGKGFVQHAFDTKLDTFGFLKSMPALHRDFDEAMRGCIGVPEPWFKWYPVKEQLLTGLDNAAPLLVDMGGGKGHELQAFCNAWQVQDGQLVLQDMDEVIDSIGTVDLNPAITKQKHDFFTSQPVQGARAYFLRHILHDWSDDYCCRILRELHGAMRPGYSKLLIHELVLPDEGATRTQCELDMLMMAFNSGLERSKSQWMKLLSEAGFEVVNVWQEYPEYDGIIEAMVPCV